MSISYVIDNIEHRLSDMLNDLLGATQPQLPPPEPFREPKSASPRALELAEKLKLDGNVKLTNGEIKAVYGITSPNIMSQARALLRLEGVLA